MLPLQPAIDFANKQGGINYVFLKQDYTAKESEFESIALSAKNYRSIRGVEWE
jgi:hypothetical protein